MELEPAPLRVSEVGVAVSNTWPNWLAVDPVEPVAPVLPVLAALLEPHAAAVRERATTAAVVTGSLRDSLSLRAR
jgi:hypothetical protein